MHFSYSVTTLLLSVEILFSCEDLPEKGFASLIDRPYSSSEVIHRAGDERPGF
jgi:hypothetical protein